MMMMKNEKCDMKLKLTHNYKRGKTCLSSASSVRQYSAKDELIVPVYMI